MKTLALFACLAATATAAVAPSIEPNLRSIKSGRLVSVVGGVVPLQANEYVLDSNGVAGPSTGPLVPHPNAASELKDPADVARDWSSAVEMAREAMTVPQRLGEKLSAPPQSIASVPFLNPPPTDHSPQRPRQRRPIPFGPRDLINRDYQPPSLPPGSLPWPIRDGYFWLIPLASNSAGAVLYRAAPATPDADK
jgi:hypothetical protein